MRLIELVIRAIIKIIRFFGLWVPIGYIIFGIFLTINYDFNPLNLDSILSKLYFTGLIGSFICSIIITFRSIFIKPFKTRIEMNKTKQELKKFIETENLREKEFHLKRQESIAAKEENLAKKEWELNQKIERLSKKRSRSERKLMKKSKDKEIDFDYIDTKAEQNLTYNIPSKRKMKDNFVGSDKLAEYRSPAPLEQETYHSEERPLIYNSAVDPNLLIHEFKNRFVVYREEGTRMILEKVEYK